MFLVHIQTIHLRGESRPSRVQLSSIWTLFKLLLGHCISSKQAMRKARNIFASNNNSFRAISWTASVNLVGVNFYLKIRLKPACLPHLKESCIILIHVHVAQKKYFLWSSFNSQPFKAYYFMAWQTVDWFLSFLYIFLKVTSSSKRIIILVE